MRNLIIDLIIKEKKLNYFLTADLGFSVLEKISKIYKSRFINVGVSENNMYLLATGISENLKKNQCVYVYSIAPFLILRSIEIIRNYINNENRNIKMIGVGSGYSYSTMGKTHFIIEDLNILYGLKNILILNPANQVELKYLFKKFKNSRRPIYFRINKSSGISMRDNNFSNKNGLFYKKGVGTNIICSGYILNYLMDFFSKREISKLNILSIPIFNENYNKDILSYLNKNKKLLLLTDSNKTVYFESIKSDFDKISKLNNWNIDLNTNNVKNVGTEIEVLIQSGLIKKKIRDFVLK